MAAGYIPTNAEFIEFLHVQSQALFGDTRELISRKHFDRTRPEGWATSATICARHQLPTPNTGKAWDALVNSLTGKCVADGGTHWTALRNQSLGTRDAPPRLADLHDAEEEANAPALRAFAMRTETDTGRCPHSGHVIVRTREYFCLR